jgi:hypothetical protein
MNNNGYIEAGPSSHTLTTDPPVHLRVTGADVFGNKRKIETTSRSCDDNVFEKKQKTGEKQKFRFSCSGSSDNDRLGFLISWALWSICTTMPGYRPTLDLIPSTSY